MKSALFKDTIREIKKTFGRFISIFGIVLVGVAFFVGVKASAPYMKRSADAYFDRENLFDLKIYSPVGFSDEDVEDVGNTDGISRAEGAYVTNAVADVGTSEKVFQIMSYDPENDDPINKLTLVEGRLPEKSGECVIRYYEMRDGELGVGDTLNLSSGTDTAITDSTLNDDTYTIVGKVTTPYYLSYQYDSASVGNGKVEYLMYIPLDEFKGNLLYKDSGYNVIYAAIDGAAALDTYSDEYFDLTDPVKERVKELGENTMEELAVWQMIPSDGSIPLKWYVYDRNSHFSYVDYGNCGDRMDAIAKIFPAFFYLVAALVCLTTMTRMVDEQRQIIGTLKALGYNKFRIAMKYITYAAVASLSGGVIGCFVGLNTFPGIIFTAWNTVYTVDGLVPAPQIALCIVAVAIAVFVTVVAVIAACIGELTEEPAMLLRPKSPKNGKKVILERIGFIWKRMSFTGKVTARNILRYKKRFFMTVIGIAGCTALILAGFGIKNSVATVMVGQYEDILAYDISGMFTDRSDKDAFKKECDSSDMVENVYIDTQYSGTANIDGDSSGSSTKNITFVSVDDADKYAEFVTLTDHKKGNKIKIPDDGALISYKMAKDFDISVGDSLYVSISDDKYYKVEVSGIINMYVGQYVFMQDSYYEKCFGEPAPHNSFIANLTSTDMDRQQQFGSDIMKKFNMESISYFSGIKDNFGDLISSLNIITVVLIVSAALLAFVVLYNLINVNISERIREIATIKVLGFYDNEVEMYVYRENIVLSIIGSLVGLVLGVFLHRYIMNVIEMDDVIFPNKIFWYSYFISVAITIIFGLMVNLAMKKRLKRIPMVESLKSVE